MAAYVLTLDAAITMDSEPVGPVVPSPREQADAAVMHVELQAVTVVFDFVYPPLAARRLGSKGCQRRLDEPRHGPRLHARQPPGRLQRGRLEHILSPRRRHTLHWTPDHARSLARHSAEVRMKEARNQEERRLASELAFVFLSAVPTFLTACFTCFADFRIFHCHTGTWTCPRFDGRLRAWDQIKR